MLDYAQRRYDGLSIENLSLVERCHVATKSATRVRSENDSTDVEAAAKAAPKKRAASRTKAPKEGAAAKKPGRSRAQADDAVTPDVESDDVVESAATPEEPEALEEVEVDDDLEVDEDVDDEAEEDEDDESDSDDDEADKPTFVGTMVNVEELDPKPFINLLNTMGLPSRIKDENGDRALTF